MGKYPNSDLHAKYSDMHVELLKIDDKYRRCYVSDIDRFWFEYDFRSQAVVAAIDIKKHSDILKEGIGMTPTEAGSYAWLIKAGARVFVVYITDDFNNFIIKPFLSNTLYILDNKTQYGDWLLSLRNGNSFLETLPSMSTTEYIETVKRTNYKETNVVRLFS